ncbi:hypothetical protein [Corynebacterium callunae]|uniref:hypothetical protein n=1 Tax=Corynebacterium callunae TaxID=1721 RepID=UPI001FFFA497|nr:hypothetical protein [Corynebacterium callunae]MCK2200196.1 hypothetical protein [Corynebacterium callunae]
MNEQVEFQSESQLDKTRLAASIMRDIRRNPEVNPFNWDFEFRLAQALAAEGLI